MKNNKTVTPTAINGEPTTKQKNVAAVSRFMKRTLGLLLIFLTTVLYIQIVPLAMVLAGGIIGIEPGVVDLTMDVMIWMLTALSILIPMVYFYIKWVYYLWMRFVITPTPFKHLFGLTRKKHA